MLEALILQHAPEPLLVFEGEKVCLVNERASFLFGYRAEELNGRLFNQIFPDLPSLSDPVLVGKVIKAVKKEGVAFKAQISTSEFSFEARQLTVLFLRDVTTIEEAKVQQEGERSRDLNMISHQFVYINALLEQLRNPSVHGGKLLNDNALSDLHKSLSRYQAYVHIRSGGSITITPSVFSLFELLGQLIEKGKKNFEGKGEIVLNFPNRDLLICADLEKLTFVLEKLIASAIKHTERGSIEIDCTQFVETRSWQIRVKDSGCGIDPTILQAMLSGKTLTDEFRTRRFSSAGLGLSVCRSYLEAMQGELKGESVEGQGTTFTITFSESMPQSPDTRESSLEPSRKSSSVEASSMTANTLHSTPSILVVDDQRVIQTLLCGLLKSQLKNFLNSEEFTIDIASNGQEALEKVQGKHYDLILMDLQMPVMDGLASTRAIRDFLNNHPERRKIYISACTANATEGSACKEAGMDRFMGKPISAQALASLLKIVFKKP